MSELASFHGLEPEDLDGHTLDELSEYLERDRRPVDPTIEDSAACQLALRALQQLRDLAAGYLDGESTAPPSGPDWIPAVLARLPLDVRAGRRYEFPVLGDSLDAVITEGAIRGLARAIGDRVPGVLVGAVRLGDVSPVEFDIDIAVEHGIRIPSAATAYRHELGIALQRQVPFPVGAINIHVRWLIEPAGTRAARAGG